MIKTQIPFIDFAAIVSFLCWTEGNTDLEQTVSEVSLIYAIAA